MHRRLFPILVATSLTACATFDDRQLGTVRAQRVAPQVYTKLSRGLPLEASDVIELTRRGVAESLILRQIQEHGIASLVERNDLLKMQKADVPKSVIDAMLLASRDFARRYAATDYDGSFGSDYGLWPWHGGVGVNAGPARRYGGW